MANKASQRLSYAIQKENKDLCI